MNKSEFLRRFHRLGQIAPEPDHPLGKPGRPAAVLCPVVLRQHGLTLLFTQRAAHLKHHAGQVSFPGGKQEPQDHNLLATALRETEEEIGLHQRHIEIIGTLPRYRTISKFAVQPYVGLVTPPFSLTLDSNEVDRVFEVPLAYMANKANHHTHWVERKGQQHPVYFIPWQGVNIWGATAAFVRNLSSLLAEREL